MMWEAPETMRLTARDVLDADYNSGMSLAYVLQWRHGPPSDIADYWIHRNEPWNDWTRITFTRKISAEAKLYWMCDHWWYRRYEWRLIERITQDTVVRPRCSE